MKVKSGVYIHNMRLLESGTTPFRGPLQENRTRVGTSAVSSPRPSRVPGPDGCHRQPPISLEWQRAGGRGGTEGGPSRLVVNRQLFSAPLRDRQGNATDARELVLSAAATGRLTLGAFRSCIFGPVPKTGATEVDVPSGECLTINWRFPQLSPGKGDECLHLLVISA